MWMCHDGMRLKHMAIVIRLYAHTNKIDLVEDAEQDERSVDVGDLNSG